MGVRIHSDGGCVEEGGKGRYICGDVVVMSCMKGRDRLTANGKVN